MGHRIVVVMLLALALAGCDSTVNAILQDLLPQADVHRTDAAADVALAVDTVDVAPGETVAPAEDIWVFDVGEPDVPFVECEPGDGCFLDPCEANDQCQSGWCVEHMGAGVCTQLCTEECPPGWSCNPAGSGPDLTYICVSKVANLCKPCATTEGCKSPGGAEDVCVDYGLEGSFCGGMCQTAQDCPWGFSCVDAQTVDGVAVKQCIADAGLCPCTGRSIALALSTPCSVSNEFGLCQGKRVCLEEGLSACDAGNPAMETCNGLDDNCDGDIDEDTCDDGDACTADSCLGEAGCSHEPLDVGECVDGNPCTVADHCVAGECVGSPVQCDDSNPCTDDSCDETGGCLFTDNVAKCDDGDPCTVGDVCGEGQCEGYAVDCQCDVDADCVALEDGDVCNGTLVCDTSSLPHQCVVDPVTVKVCPGPQGFCEKAQCDGETGVCSIVPANEGFACNDDNPCTVGETCSAGTCDGGMPLNCNDGNPCTDDLCDPQSGCQNTPNAAPCNDNNPCTTNDFCSEGSCAGGVSLDCDDDNLCNGAESCDPVKGCVAGAPLSCDDDNICNGMEGCHPLLGCQGGDALVCNDNNVCTDDSCHPKDGCVYTQNKAACDDGNACTTGDQCLMGSCQFNGTLDCDDNNPCTKDSCDPALGCVNVAASGACDDGNPCTLNDQCVDGACKSGATVNCDDGNPCTDDSCNEQGLCVHVANEADCDDGNACTVGDHCQAGQCVKGGLLNCDDENVCTSDSCDPDTGCVHLLNTVPCDDGDLCTTGDTCQLGECQGTGTLTCNDGNPCTDDACDAAVGCTFVPNSAPCNDGNACTTVDVCSGGVCVGSQELNCDDDNICTTDSCQIAVGCVHVNNANPCDDGSLCTVEDVCSDGTCLPGEALNCNDDNVCTDDSCNPETGCVNAANSAACDDGNACTENDLCANGDCGGDTITCDDAKACTTDSCDPDSGCVYTPITPCCGNGVKEAGEECDDGNNVNGDGCQSDCTNPSVACSVVAKAACAAKGWQYVGGYDGNIVCTIDGRGTGSNCDTCSTYNIYVWKNGSKELHCPQYNYSTVAGKYYSAHTPCTCGNNLDLCGSWDMKGCIPD